MSYEMSVKCVSKMQSIGCYSRRYIYLSQRYETIDKDALQHTLFLEERILHLERTNVQEEI